MKRQFRALVDEHQKLVYSQAMYILADKGEAEDVTQEAFERLWSEMNKQTSQFEVNSTRGWLLTVVRNRSIDKLRRRKPLTETELDAVESTSADSKPVASLMSKQLSHWLSDAIERLKEPYRSLIILADLQQRSIKDVANTLELNENQAKVYIHRGRKQLRTLLQGVEL